METIENGFGGRVHNGEPASSLLTLAIVFKVTLGLLKWLKNGTLDCEAIYLLYHWLLPL